MTYRGRYFNTVRFRTPDVGVSDCLRYAHGRGVVPFLPTTPGTAAQVLCGCCTPSAAPQLPKQQLLRQALGQQRVRAWNVSERLRAARPSTSHLKDQSRGTSNGWVPGKVFCSPESKQLTFRSPSSPPSAATAPMNNVRLEFTPRHSQKASCFRVFHCNSPA